jgi:hypothetical protein
MPKIAAKLARPEHRPDGNARLRTPYIDISRCRADVNGTYGAESNNPDLFDD